MINLEGQLHHVPCKIALSLQQVRMHVAADGLPSCAADVQPGLADGQGGDQGCGGLPGQEREEGGIVAYERCAHVSALRTCASVHTDVGARSAAGVSAVMQLRVATQVGVVGFCMGGALTLIAAQHANVAAAAPFYGTPQVSIHLPPLVSPTHCWLQLLNHSRTANGAHDCSVALELPCLQEGICQVEKIKVPVLLQAGEDDSMEGFSTPKETKAVAEKIKVCTKRLPHNFCLTTATLQTQIVELKAHSNCALQQ